MTSREYWNCVWRGLDIEQYRVWFLRKMNSSPPFIEMFRRFNVKTVCDVACGFGSYTAMLIKHGFQLSAFDLSEASIALTQHLLSDYGLDAELTVAALPETPYANHHFDAVVAHAVLDHLPCAQLLPSIRELRRIVRPGGLVYISFDPLEEDDLLFPHTVQPDGSFLYTDGDRTGLLFRYYTDAELDVLLNSFTVYWKRISPRGDREYIILA